MTVNADLRAFGTADALMKHRLILCMILSLICAVLAGCGSSNGGPEDALRTWVSEAEVAAEERDRRGLLALISENYADSRGND
jgi:predicted small secreted protein